MGSSSYRELSKKVDATEPMNPWQPTVKKTEWLVCVIIQFHESCPYASHPLGLWVHNCANGSPEMLMPSAMFRASSDPRLGFIILSMSGTSRIATT